MSAAELERLVPHLAAGVLDGIAGGALPTASDADHLSRCGRCRAELADRDPGAIFALLGVLESPVPAWPGLQGGHRRGERTLRAGLAAAVALLVFLSLFAALHSPAPQASSGIALADIAPRTGNSPAIVSGVTSPTAKIMTLVPAGGEGPSVTLIIDEEFDL